MEAMQAHHTHSAQEHKNHQLLRTLAISTAIVAGAVILAPYVLPALGIGDSALAAQALSAMHGNGLGNGLAGALNGVISGIPLIGGELAKNGFLSAATSGIIGIGGVMLGHYIQQKEDGTKAISWGKLVATASLLTSALIALPSVLTGLSVGIVYMCAAFSGVALASKAVGVMAKTLGSVGSMNAANLGLTGALASLPHLLACCAAAVPTVMSYSMWKKDGASVENPHSDGSIMSRVEVDAPTQVGAPCNAKLYLTHRGSNAPLTADELAVVHTKKLHVFVADSSLQDYQHIHPQPTGEPGVYTFSFTPKTSNNYSAWADITMLKDNQNHKLKTTMRSASGRNIPPRITPSTLQFSGDLVFDWEPKSALVAGQSGMVSVSVSDVLGNPVTDLEPVMGAAAHLVGFSADGKSIIHTHPLDDASPSTLRFHVEPQHVGDTQFYLQVRRKGEDVFVPFGQNIKPPLRDVERYRNSTKQTFAMGY
jgi:hypothetical protein